MSIIIKRLQDLVDDLRVNGITISPTELINAIETLSRTGIPSLSFFQGVLKVNLIKSHDNYQLFAILFEKHFPEFFLVKQDTEELKTTLQKVTDQIEKHERLRRKEKREEEALETYAKQVTEKDKLLEKKLKEAQEKTRKREEKLDALREKKERLEDALDTKEQLENKMKENQEQHEQELQEKEKKKEKFKELKEKLGTERIVPPPPLPIDEKEAAHGDDERHEEVKQSSSETKSEQQAKEARERYEQELQEMRERMGRGREGKEGEEGEGRRGVGGVGGDPRGEKDPSTGLSSRPNATPDNNPTLHQLSEMYQRTSIADAMQGLFTNNLEVTKKRLLDQYQYQIARDPQHIKKGVTRVKQEIKHFLIERRDIPLVERKEIFAELIKRLHQIENYDYKKALLKRHYLKLSGKRRLNLDSLNFKNLQNLYSETPELYVLVMKELRKRIQALAAIFKEKISRRYKEMKKGVLSPKKTFSYNLKKYGDEIGELIYKKPKRKKADFFVLCDVSYSVNHISELFLSFLEATSQTFRTLTIYLFVSNIHELKNFRDYSSILQEIGHEYSDMRTAFGELNELDIPKETALVILTDCRTNNYDYHTEDEMGRGYPFSYESLREVKEKVPHTLILNPEPRVEWNTGGGGASAREYIEISKVPVFEFYNIYTLEKAIKHLRKIVG